MDTQPDRSLFLPRLRRAMAFLRPYRVSVYAILGIAMALAALNALEPLILKYLLDHLVGPTGQRALVIGIAGLGGLAVLREASNAVSNWLTWRTRIGVQYGLQCATVGKLHSLPVSFHRTEGVGATMTKLDRGIQGLVGALGEIAFNVIPAAVYLVIAVVVMLRLDWRLGLVVMAFAPIPAVIATWAAGPQTRRERTLMDWWIKIYSRFNEVLTGIVTVKSFAMEEAEKQRFLQDVDQANQVVVRGVRWDSMVGVGQGLVIATARIAAIGLGGWFAYRGEMTVGTLVAFLGYVGGLFAPVQGLSGTYRTLRTAAVSLDQVFSILDAQDHLGDRPGATELKGIRGHVVFDNVSFSYDQPDRPLLDSISLEVRPGESVALVGPSGAGKTTMMALLQRLYDPTSGSIRLDGVDLRDVKQRSLRWNIGSVLQESLLFNETVAANIAYGRPAASREQIEAAARAANAHEFIARLPQGYETIVGERGSRLSAGERQRVAIARALLKDPAILILDEPTSALDAESEVLVQQALLRLAHGRTTFAIAHRLSTVVDSDRILVLRNGRIAESGSHRELMQQAGYYAQLVTQQTHRLVDRAA